MPNRINTCFQCKDRVLGCHSKCEKYNKAKKEIEANREKLDICNEFLITNATRRKKVRGWDSRK